MIIKFGAILSLMIFLFVVFMPSVLALSADEVEELRAQYKAKLIKDPIAFCQTNLVPALDLEQQEFFNFLDIHFQNKASNSSLTNIAISRYAEHKRTLQDLLAIVKPGGTTNTALYKQEAAAYIDCQKSVDVYTAQAKDKMIEHIRKNTAQKKTTIMVEKYQAINGKLRELNLKIAKMYGLLMTFKEKLPGFVKKCIK